MSNSVSLQALVFWPNENSVIVVPLSRLLEGSPVGDECSIMAGRLHYRGKIAAIGNSIWCS